MVFGCFLKDIRIMLGLTQEQMANHLHISEKTYAGYETLRRQCRFDFALEILNVLNVPVLIKNNEITIVREDLKMNKIYENNINFDDFSTKESIERIYSFRAETIKRAVEAFEKADAKAESLGFERYYYDSFTAKSWLDEHYESGTRIASFTKDGKTITLLVEGCFNVNMFVLERFIELLKEKSKDEVADFILKEILYYQETQDGGREVYNAFHKKDSIEIFRILPMSKVHSDLIMGVLNKHYDELFVDVNGGYNPEEISISNELGMYDCFSTPNLYYLFKMEDGEEVISYESFFEGHSIEDAINYVQEYFEDYGMYEDEYNHLDEDWEDSKIDILVYR